MLKIGDFSKLAQVSVKTLRYYAELGLLSPAWIDRFTGYRYYTPEQLPRLNRILALKDLGLSLEQIAGLLNEDLPPAELRGMLRMKATELEQIVAEERARLARVEARLEQVGQEGGAPAYDVVLKSLPRRRILGLRRTVAAYHEVWELLNLLCTHMEAHQLERDATHPCLILYHDAEYREQRVDIEVAAIPARPIPTGPGMTARTLTEIPQAACTVHHGRLESLPRAYHALLSWIERNGYQAGTPHREVYLQGPQGDSPGEQIVVEVQFPIQPRAISVYLSQLVKEKDKMQPMIMTKPAFSVVGLKYRGKNEHNEIAEMWGEANVRAEEIVAAATGLGAAYGVCRDMEADGVFEYLAGLEIKEIEEVPEGMERWEVPEQTYAVFPCKLATIGEAYRYAFEEWLPTSGYRRAPGPDFEYYDASFDPENAENSQLYIYVPVEKSE